jgi:peptide deformylase
MFAILNFPKIIPGKWMNYEKLTPNDYRIIINPVLLSESTLRLKDFEECPSIPGLRFHIWNPVYQNYKYHIANVVKDKLTFEEKSS